jgi:hypothetical protein
VSITSRFEAFFLALDLLLSLNDSCFHVQQIMYRPGALFPYRNVVPRTRYWKPATEKKTAGGVRSEGPTQSKPQFAANALERGVNLYVLICIN